MRRTQKNKTAEEKLKSFAEQCAMSNSSSASSMKHSVKSAFLLMLFMSRFFGRSGHWKRCWIQQAKYVINTETGFEDPKPASKRAPGIWIIPELWRTNEPCLSQLPCSWEGIRNLRLCALSKFSTVSYSNLRKISSLWAEAPDFYTWVVPALSLCQAMTCKPTAEDTGGTALRSPLAKQKNKGE